MTDECEICGRKEGSELDRCGEPDGVPLGPLKRCETCDRLACPDCLHEADCCFAEADKHAGEPEWTPQGWAKSERPNTPGMIEYVRV